MNTDEHGAPGLRCEKHGARGSCNVAGCSTRSAGKVHHSDDLALAGPRCVKHGARRCNVNMCGAKGSLRLTEPDGHGVAGLRCWKHRGDTVMKCVVAGCLQSPRFKAVIRDKYGPAGSCRCILHGGRRRCAVPSWKEGENTFLMYYRKRRWEGSNSLPQVRVDYSHH